MITKDRSFRESKQLINTKNSFLDNYSNKKKIFRADSSLRKFNFSKLPENKSMNLFKPAEVLIVAVLDIFLLEINILIISF